MATSHPKTEYPPQAERARVNAVADERDHDEPPWLIATLFSDPHDQMRPAASFVLGILGLTAFAIGTSAAAGVYVAWAARINAQSTEWISSAAEIFAFLPLAGAYVAVLLTLHLIGSCDLLLTIRLSLVYAILYVSLSAMFHGLPQPFMSVYVLYGASFCLGSFLQRRFGRWHAISWKQSRQPSEKVSIGSLLDVTAAIALTLWLLGLGNPSPVAAYACLTPSACLGGVLGMHVWARLTALCSDSSDSVSGFGFWMAGSISLACVIWLVLAIVVDQTPLRLIGFGAAVLVVLVAHCWTELQIRWLKACGWQLVRE